MGVVALFGAMIRLTLTMATPRTALSQPAHLSSTSPRSPTFRSDRLQLTYNQWVTVLQQEAISTANRSPHPLVVLAGDSLSLWFPPSLLDTRITWLNQSISGETSAGLLQRISLFDVTEPTVILVMIGINDLIRSISPETIIANQREILRCLKAAHPKARIVVQSILPHVGTGIRHYSQPAKPPLWVLRLPSMPNASIRTLNQTLAKMAHEEGVDYLDLFPHFADAEGNLRAELTTDGLHLSWAGYQVWRSQLSSILPQPRP